jgi:20S proteasome alpha/beta subunit
MAESATLVAALRFRNGVVVGADSQASDLVVGVRWPVEKLARIGPHPLVVGFSGSLGMGQRARKALDDLDLRATTFKKPELVQQAIDRALQPIHEAIKKNNNPPAPNPIYEIGLAGLAVFWAGNAPHIHEREINGDSCFHKCFHAIGSGSQTAYAVFRTLGGPRLAELDEPKALMALLRILRTSVHVDVLGVSEPFYAFIVTAKGVRQLSGDELQPHLQAVDEWESDERERFFGDNICR